MFSSAGAVVVSLRKELLYSCYSSLFNFINRDLTLTRELNAELVMSYLSGRVYWVPTLLSMGY